MRKKRLRNWIFEADLLSADGSQKTKVIGYAIGKWYFRKLALEVAAMSGAKVLGVSCIGDCFRHVTDTAQEFSLEEYEYFHKTYTSSKAVLQDVDILKLKNPFGVRVPEKEAAHVQDL